MPQLNVKNSSRCFVCGRPLTSPASIARGTGSVCGRGFKNSYRQKACDSTREMFDAEFSYKMRGETLVIYDADIGGKSVTNDMENVLMRIIKEIGKPDHDTPVVYMDSQGDFAGVLYWPVTRQVKFIGLGDTTNEKEAVEAMQQHMEGLKNG